MTQSLIPHSVSMSRIPATVAIARIAWLGAACRRSTPFLSEPHRWRKRRSIAASWRALITKISPSPPGFCRSGCGSISTMSMPIAAFRTIWAMKSAIPRHRCNCSDQWEAELNACYAGQSAASGVCRVGGDGARVRYPQAAVFRFAEGISAGPDHYPLSRLSRMCWATAAIRRIPSDIWCSTSADIAMPNARLFPISPARRCNWRTSGRT